LVNTSFALNAVVAPPAANADDVDSARPVNAPNAATDKNQRREDRRSSQMEHMIEVLSIHLMRVLIENLNA
jgi:hypothetical protein